MNKSKNTPNLKSWVLQNPSSQSQTKINRDHQSMTVSGPFVVAPGVIVSEAEKAIVSQSSHWSDFGVLVGSQGAV